MQRVNHPTAVPPNDPQSGQFTEADPPATPATIAPAAWLNSLQNEIANAVLASHPSLSTADDTQLLTSIRALARPTFRNALVNGRLDLWQRGSVFNSIGTPTYTADRWLILPGMGTSVGQVQRIPLAPGIGEGEPLLAKMGGEPVFSMRVVLAADPTSGFNELVQRIEGVRWGAAQDVTLSGVFILVSGGPGENVSEVTPVVRQNFGAGGSAEVELVGTAIPIDEADGWKLIEQAFALPGIAGKTVGTDSYVEIGLRFPYDDMAIFEFACLQAEEGSARSAFEFIPFEVDLFRALRYYEKSYQLLSPIGAGTNAGQARGFSDDTGGELIGLDTRFRVPKRTGNPTITWFDHQSQSDSSQHAGVIHPITGTVATSEERTGKPTTSLTTSGLGESRAHWTADAEL